MFKILGKLTRLMKSNKTTTKLNSGIIQYCKSNISKIENPTQKKMVSVFEGEKVIIADDFIKKLEMCEDVNLKARILEIIKIYEKSPKSEQLKTMSELEEILDAVNVTKQKYTPLFKAGSMENLSEIRTAYNILSAKKSFNIDAFRKNARFTNIKECIAQNPNAYELHNYLYNKYYIKSLIQQGAEQKIIQQLQNINEKYGVKLFFSDLNPQTKHSLDYIEKELGIWYEKSNGTAKFPNMIDVNEFYSYFLSQNKKYSNGFYSSEKNVIGIRGTENTKKLRHEMIHVQDIVFSAKATKYTSDEIKQLESAGVKKNHIKYGETAECESIAVALDEEADSTIYTENFVNKLCTRGLPRYTIGMPQHGQKFFENILREELKGENIDIAITKIKGSFNGKFPDEIAKYILSFKNKDKILNLINRQYELHTDLRFKNAEDFISHIHKKVVQTFIKEKIFG